MYNFFMIYVEGKNMPYKRFETLEEVIMKLFDRISEREKFVVIVIALVLLFCFGILSCKPKSDVDSLSTYTPPVRQTVVVDKISISNGKYQCFVVSGKNFEFSTRQLVFNVNDTIIIEGDKVFAKNKPFNSIDTY